MKNLTIQQGWECPKCGRVYSPTTGMCYTCVNQTESIISTSTDGINFQASGTSTAMIHNFTVSKDCKSKEPVCSICGLEKWRHPVFTQTKNK